MDFHVLTPAGPVLIMSTQCNGEDESAPLLVISKQRVPTLPISPTGADPTAPEPST